MMEELYLNLLTLKDLDELFRYEFQVARLFDCKEHLLAEVLLILAPNNHNCGEQDQVEQIHLNLHCKVNE